MKPQTKSLTPRFFVPFLYLILTALLFFSGCKPRTTGKPVPELKKNNSASGALPSILNKDNIFDSDERKRDFFLALTQRYSPDAYYILSSEPGYTRYVTYADGRTHAEMLESYGTVVHESCHIQNFRTGGYGNTGYFVKKGIELVVPRTKVFNSRELDSVLPQAAEYREKVFRYNTYIADGDDIGAKVNGIYGLLEEFCAYYNGTRVQNDLDVYYESIAPYNDIERWKAFLSNSQSELYAYHEFRLFMAWYLNHAEQKYPDIYKGIMANVKLKVVFTLLDNAYKKEVLRYFAIREKIMAGMKQQGIDCYVRDGFFMVSTSNGNSTGGVGAPDDVIAYLEGLLTPKDIAQLKQLRLESINEQNFKQYFD